MVNFITNISNYEQEIGSNTISCLANVLIKLAKNQFYFRGGNNNEKR
jgi:hypothetical protein